MRYSSLLKRVHAILQSSILLTLLELDRRSIYQHAFLLYYTGIGEGRERGGDVYTFIYRLSCFASDSIKREEQVYIPGRNIYFREKEVILQVFDRPLMIE